MSTPAKSLKVPQDMQAKYAEITALTDAVCAQHLNDEYAELTRYLVAALCRKRTSPLAKGKAASWACGAVYALGFVNFLFDKDNQSYLSSAELCAAFGVSQSNGSGKAAEIKKLFGMHQMDPNWCLPSLRDSNPMAWLIQVNGLMIDARQAPREIQEIAFEKGLIPYIPADKQAAEAAVSLTDLPTPKLFFQVGDVVKVKPGVSEVDDATLSLAGWQGRVSELEEDEEGTPLLCIEWDSITLRNLSPALIARYEEQGISWTSYYLAVNEVEAAEARDTPEDVAAAIEELEDNHAWDYLGESGARIQAILEDVDPEDDWEALEAWQTYLQDHLRFPFDAEIVEFQEKGPLKQGQEVKVMDFNMMDDLFGLIMDVKRNKTPYMFPLCDLEVMDKKSLNYQPVKDFAVWFANR